MEPELIGPYEVLRTLGSGGMGKVYLCLDEDGRTVAVKVIHPHLVGEARGAQRLEREAEAMRRVRSPHVAELLDVQLQVEAPYLVTRYVQGRTLDRIVRDRGPLSGDALRAVASGVARGLAAIHEAGVVHRDVTPRNVIMADGVPVIIDLGIARSMDFTRMTHGVIGTPGYLPPEVLNGAPPAPSADIFAWGATVAFAATSRECFTGTTLVEIITKILTAAPVLDGVPEEFLAEITAALDKTPENRPTAATLAASPPPTDHPTSNADAPPQPPIDQSTPDQLVPGDVPPRSAPVPGGWSKPGRPASGGDGSPQSPSDRSAPGQPAPGDVPPGSAPVPGGWSAPGQAAGGGDVPAQSQSPGGWSAPGGDGPARPASGAGGRGEGFEVAWQEFRRNLAGGQVGGAVAAGREMVRIAAEGRGAETAAVAHRSLGEALSAADDMMGARFQFEQGREAAVAAGRRDLEAACLHGLGVCASDQNDPARAEHLHNAAIAIALEIGNPAIESVSAYELAVAAELRHDYARAEFLFERVRHLAVTTGSLNDQAHALLGLGSCAAERGDLHRAEAALTEALDLAHRLQDRALEDWALESLTTLVRRPRR